MVNTRGQEKRRIIYWDRVVKDHHHTVTSIPFKRESELLAQQSMRAKWKSTHGGRYETIQGLAVEDHLRVLRDRLVPSIFANVANDWHLARERSSAQCSSPSPGLTVASVHGRQNDIWSFKRRAAVEPVDWLDTLGLAGGRIS
jgi:hypothetical protein